MEEKAKLYYKFSDGQHVSEIVMKLSGCIAWMESTEEDPDFPNTFTLEPVYLTDEEYEKLPEAEL
jgi:hypothetical protein